MTMPLANFDFDGMFHLSDDEDEIPYFEASYFLWIVFVVILAVLFLNLLVSSSKLCTVCSRPATVILCKVRDFSNISAYD